jgi:DNA topoisomerase-3
MAIALITEKPAVARDIAKVIGATKNQGNFLSGNGYIVSWAIGHLVSIAEPHQINPAWRSWRADCLPMLPEHWPLVVYDKTKDQFETLKRLFNSPKIERIICATDAGREGELIFRYIYEATGANKPVDRLWMSSLTPSAIASALANLRPASEYDGLAAAARGRSRADWLVGMNLSRAYTIAHGEMLSVGRVQTPTLAMIVSREIAIRDFVPEPYCQVRATFCLHNHVIADASADVSPPPAGDFAGAGSVPPNVNSYTGIYFDPSKQAPTKVALDRLLPAENSPEVERIQSQRRLPGDGILAQIIAARARTGEATISDFKIREHRDPPPLLYDLTELQRHANLVFGFHAQQTLDLAQSLYEKRKAITYPRTDSRYLTPDLQGELPAIAAAVGHTYRHLIAAETGQSELGKRFVDASKVGDHHAIIPTLTDPAKLGLVGDEAKLFDLICRRFLMAWQGEYIYSSTSVTTQIVNIDQASNPVVDHYRSSGTTVHDLGWKRLEFSAGQGRTSAPAPTAKKDATDAATAAEQALPRELEKGLQVRAIDAQVLKRQTKPPPRLSDATLLTAMESAGKALDEKELSQAMRESGLGTPATRASIIETLLKREYIVRQGKSFAATEKGIALIEMVHSEVKSPSMTGRWEQALQQFERRQTSGPAVSSSLSNFLREIEAYVAEVVNKVLNDRVPSPPRTTNRNDTESPSPYLRTIAQTSASPTQARVSAIEFSQPIAATTAIARRPKSNKSWTDRSLVEIVREVFGFSGFRPNQREICEAVARGEDTLVVMPTGAGKSLCYQVPGLARGGTTLVISPLIALMEDQVAKMRELGLRAERIHSGRDRSESRQVCADYLRGELDFLFIAPERLAVPGFPEFLAKRKPSLIAIDEAHCISQWGHDFRPDYRLLHTRLPLLRPAPIVALTATATPTVAADIVTQLGCAPATHRFILGFRRNNIAVEVAQQSLPDRDATVFELLKDPARRPAIVYAPTRARALELGETLDRRYRVGVYHAGLPVEERDRVQERFMSGQLEVIVATVAFGMGIDKADVRTVIHLALPASVEGYYQEIGRAGRDGLPSRALLLYSFVDRKTHDFFLRRDYPETLDLSAIFRHLSRTPLAKSKLARKARLKDETFESALNKLVAHGGAIVDANEEVTLGHQRWQQSYEKQRAHKQAQLDAMFDFAEGETCRMLQLIGHFGDQKDSQQPCGSCDWCDPRACLVLHWREPNLAEKRLLLAIVNLLQNGSGWSLSALAKHLACDDQNMLRACLRALARARLIGSEQATFEDGERTIHYQRYFISSEATANISEVRMLDAQDVAASKTGKKPTVRKKSRKKSASRPTNPKVAKKKSARSSRTSR